MFTKEELDAIKSIIMRPEFLASLIFADVMGKEFTNDLIERILATVNKEHRGIINDKRPEEKKLVEVEIENSKKKQRKWVVDEIFTRNHQKRKTLKQILENTLAKIPKTGNHLKDILTELINIAYIYPKHGHAFIQTIIGDKSTHFFIDSDHRSMTTEGEKKLEDLFSEIQETMNISWKNLLHINYRMGTAVWGISSISEKTFLLLVMLAIPYVIYHVLKDVLQFSRSFAKGLTALLTSPVTFILFCYIFANPNKIPDPRTFKHILTNERCEQFKDFLNKDFVVEYEASEEKTEKKTSSTQKTNSLTSDVQQQTDNQNYILVPSQGFFKIKKRSPQKNTDQKHLSQTFLPSGNTDEKQTPSVKNYRSPLQFGKHQGEVLLVVDGQSKLLFQLPPEKESHNLAREFVDMLDEKRGQELKVVRGRSQNGFKQIRVNSRDCFELKHIKIDQRILFVRTENVKVKFNGEQIDVPFFAYWTVTNHDYKVSSNPPDATSITKFLPSLEFGQTNTNSQALKI